MSMAGLGVWATFVFLGEIFKESGQIFILGNILLFLGKKPQKIDYFWAYFYHRPALVFKSVHLATNTLHLLLEIFERFTQKAKIAQSPKQKWSLVTFTFGTVTTDELIANYVRLH